jgi:DNA-binding winged helix-turn-helix (wHTH) protein
MPATASRRLISFGQFEFETGPGLLYRGEQETLLPSRVGRLLAVFLQHPGQVLSKDELLGEVWKDAFVGEDSLTQAISMVRSALCDDPRNPTHIQTIPKRGYRFIADVGGGMDAAGRRGQLARPRRPSRVLRPCLDLLSALRRRFLWMSRRLLQLQPVHRPP